MCDNSAASIAATPEVPEIDRGRFEPAPCDMRRLLALLRSDDRESCANVTSSDGGEKPEPPSRRVQSGRFDAACAGVVHWPALTEASFVFLGAPRGLRWQRGYEPRIERPPSRA